MALAGFLLANSKKLVVGSSIANIYARDAFTARRGLATLNALHGGRFALGLGVSHIPMVEGLRGHRHGFDMLDQPACRGRRRQAARCAREQAQPQPALEVFQAPPRRRLGNAQQPRRTRQAAAAQYGQDHALIKQIIADLYDKGKGNGDRKNLQDVYYNTGLAMYSVAFEGVRNAIKSGGRPLTPAKVKTGLESLRNFDANGLLAPVTVTAQDHGGGGKTRIEMWDGAKWVPQSDWISAYNDVVMEVVKKESAEFAKTNK